MGLTLQDDMNDIFLDSGLEEDIQYTPSGEVSRTIKAVVYREGSVHSNSSGRVGGDRTTKTRIYAIAIIISTDSIEGVSLITRNVDTVVMKEREADLTTKTFTVAGIIYSDAGGWHLGLSS